MKFNTVPCRIVILQESDNGYRIGPPPPPHRVKSELYPPYGLSDPDAPGRRRPVVAHATMHA
eukprot:COSAG02_NODE_109_length_36250_cov_121.168903_1_plen_62_part_00